MFNDINENDESKIKKYFYTLRPIANLNFIWQHRKIPYMEYAKTLVETNPKSEIFAAIQELTARKQSAREHDTISKHKLLLAYFKEETERFDACLKEMKHTKNRNYVSVDEVFKSIIEDVWK